MSLYLPVSARVRILRCIMPAEEERERVEWYAITDNTTATEGTLSVQTRQARYVNDTVCGAPSPAALGLVARVLLDHSDLKLAADIPP